MSQNNYILTRDGRIVTLSDDELMHFKYIKRMKVNGKWRYFYDIGQDEKARYKKAGNAALEAKAQYQALDESFTDAYTKADSERKTINKEYDDALRAYERAKRLTKDAINHGGSWQVERAKEAEAEAKKAYDAATKKKNDFQSTTEKDLFLQHINTLKAKDNYEIAKKAAEKAAKKYMNTPLYKLETFASKAKKTINKFFKNLFKIKTVKV